MPLSKSDRFKKKKKNLFSLKWDWAPSPVLGKLGENCAISLSVCPLCLSPRSIPQFVWHHSVWHHQRPALISIQGSRAASHHTCTGGNWARSQPKAWPASRARHKHIWTIQQPMLKLMMMCSLTITKPVSKWWQLLHIWGERNYIAALWSTNLPETLVILWILSLALKYCPKLHIQAMRDSYIEDSSHFFMEATNWHQSTTRKI